jgi:hypothetical protein
MAVLSVATFISVWIGKLIYGVHFFSGYSPIAVLIGVLTSFLGLMVLNAIVVLWCSITTSAFIATLLTLFTYLIGQTVDDVVRFLTHEINLSGADISGSVRLAVDAAQYIFPNLSAFDVKLQAAHGILIPFSDIAFLGIYGIGYITAVLSISVLILNRRDFT